jgi:hypothetical protein
MIGILLVIALLIFILIGGGFIVAVSFRPVMIITCVLSGIVPRWARHRGDIA